VGEGNAGFKFRPDGVGSPKKKSQTCVSGPDNAEASSLAVRQAEILYGDVLAMLFPDHRPRRNDETWRVRDSDRLRRVDHRPSRASVEMIGSSPRRAMGLRPLLVLVDEPASGPRRSGHRLLAALRTSLGKQPGSRLIAFGTRPDDPEHWFEMMLREGPSLCFAADPLADVTNPETWAAANPSLDHMESLRERIAYEASQARARPSLLSDFRALRLNAAPEAHLIKLAHLIKPEEWRTVERSPDALPDREGKPIWGVELGGVSASSAIAATWPTGRLEVFAAFPSRPDLRQRGRDDHGGDAYTRMSDEGSLIVLGGHTMDYAGLIREGLARYGCPGSIVCCRRLRELGDALASAGLRSVRIVPGSGRRGDAELPFELLAKVGADLGSEHLVALRCATLGRHPPGTHCDTLPSTSGPPKRGYSPVFNSVDKMVASPVSSEGAGEGVVCAPPSNPLRVALPWRSRIGAPPPSPLSVRRDP